MSQVYTSLLRAQPQNHRTFFSAAERLFMMLTPGCVQLMAKRPEWNVGAKSKLSLKPKTKQQSVPVESAAASNGEAANDSAGIGEFSALHIPSAVSSCPSM